MRLLGFWAYMSVGRLDNNSTIKINSYLHEYLSESDDIYINPTPLNERNLINILSAMNKMTHMNFCPVANFNTPSQLGRTSSAICQTIAAIHPSNARSCTTWPYFALLYFALLSSAMLCFALLNHEEEELIENVSYHSLLTWSQFHLKRVSHHSYWPEVTFIDPRPISQESVSNHSYWSQINVTRKCLKPLILLLDQWRSS